jgi:hypothetical protein
MLLEIAQVLVFAGKIQKSDRVAACLDECVKPDKGC